MKKEIKSIEDVKTFFNQLLEESLNFHPDEDFTNYINGDTRQDTYTAEEAQIRNNLMLKAFEVCESNDMCIYELSQELSLNYTGLDKYIGIDYLK